MSAYRSAEPCPRCKSGTTTREGECLSCGALWGSAFFCPHCGEHAKTEADRLLGSTCATCKVPRIARPLPKEAYARLRDLLRIYRLLPARAAVYVPALALLFAVIASVISPRMIADAKNERESYIAERGTRVGAPTSKVAELLPEAPLAFLAGLGTVGALGIVVFLSIAGSFRLRIRREVARVAGLESPPASRSL